MREKAYHETQDKKNEIKLKKRLEKLPSFCKTFFIGIEPTTASRTRLAYAYDLGCFFEYMHENNPICKKMEIPDFPLSVLDQLTPTDIEEYLYFLKYYQKDGVEHYNKERGVKRKLASLRTFYRYFYKKELIKELYV